MRSVVPFAYPADTHSHQLDFVLRGYVRVEEV